MNKEDLSIKKGDIIWVELKGAANNFGHGEVTNTYIDEEVGLCFDFYCLVNGGLRTGMIKNLIKKPNRRMITKALQSQKELNEVLKTRK